LTPEIGPGLQVDREIYRCEERQRNQGQGITRREQREPAVIGIPVPDQAKFLHIGGRCATPSHDTRGHYAANVQSNHRPRPSPPAYAVGDIARRHRVSADPHPCLGAQRATSALDARSHRRTTRNTFNQEERNSEASSALPGRATGWRAVAGTRSYGRRLGVSFKQSPVRGMHIPICH